MVSIGIRKLIAHGTSLGVLAFPNARHIEPESRCLFDELDDSGFRARGRGQTCMDTHTLEEVYAQG